LGKKNNLLILLLFNKKTRRKEGEIMEKGKSPGDYWVCENCGKKGLMKDKPNDCPECNGTDLRPGRIGDFMDDF